MSDARQLFRQALRDALDTHQPDWDMRRHVTHQTIDENRQLGVWVDTLRRWVAGDNFPRVKKFEGFLESADFPSPVRDRLFKMFHSARTAPVQQAIGKAPIDPIKPFIGRQDQVNTMLRWLDSEQALLTIVGRAGIGKTALACHVLHQKIEMAVVFLAGQPPLTEAIFLSCAALAGDDYDLKQVWMSPSPLETKLKRLFAALDEQDVIILIDGIDPALDSVGRFIEPDMNTLLTHLPNSPLRLIITTQTQPFLPSGLRMHQSTLCLEDGLPIEDGVVLLQQLQVKGSLKPMVERVHGLPRALEILAGNPDVDATLDNLHANIYQQLSPGEYAVLEALAVLRNPVEPPVVAHILHLNNVLPLVQKLIHRHLVEGNRVNGYVHLKPLEAALIYPRLTDERRLQLERAAAHYFKSTEPLRAFEHLLRAGDLVEAEALIAKAHDSFIQEGRIHALIDCYQRLPVAHPRRYVGLGDALRLLGHYEQAVDAYSTAIDLARDQEETSWLGQGLLGLGSVNLAWGRYEAAVEAFEYACDYHTSLAATGLGQAYHQLGEADLALQYAPQNSILAGEILYSLGELSEATTHLESTGTDLAVHETIARYSLLGEIAMARGQLGQALSSQHQAIDLAQQAGIPWTLQQYRLGSTLVLAGQRREGERWLNQALETADYLGERYVETLTLQRLAYLRLEEDRLDMAGYIINLLLEVGYSTRSHLHWESWHTTAAIYYLMTGDLEQAHCLIQRALTHPTILDHARALTVQAMIHWRLNDTDGARAAANEAVAVAQLPRLANHWPTQYMLGVAYAGLARMESNYWLEDARQAFHRARWVCEAPGVIDEAQFWLRLLD